MKRKRLIALPVFLVLLLLLAAVLLLRYQNPAAVSSAAPENRPEAETAPGRNQTEETAVSAPDSAPATVPASTPAASNAAQSAPGESPALPQTEENPLPPEADALPATEPISDDRAGKTYDEHTYQLVTDIIYTMRNRGEEEEASIRALLAELKEANPDLGILWEGIADYWFYVCRDFTVNQGRLPDGLPTDDSLGITVLGFQLMSDGTMAPELIGRLETALACAVQYPNAYLIVTGGGTAAGNHSVTEADAMAGWLEEHGIDRSKIIVENRSLTTDQNASNTCAILAERYPGIRALAMVSSDYHVALGSMLFTEAALLYAYAHDGTAPYEVVSNAGFATSGNPVYSNPRMFPSDMWILADPHL